LDRLNLSGVRLVVLAACQTAMTDFGNVPDEAVGLPAGFLQAGATAAIGTLWPVEDLPSALLLIRFYQCHLRDGLGVASALREAQRWLRESSAAEMELANWHERLYRESGSQNALLKAAHHSAKPGEKPFAHPCYWAAFTLTGASS
jgi:CHAT domain-containing protein